MNITITGRYLILPIYKNTEEHVLRIFADGIEITEFMVPSGEGITEITEATEAMKAEVPAPDFETALNLGAFAGQTLELRGEFPEVFLRQIRVSDKLPSPVSNRPLIHYSPERGWGNDPNGLIFHDGIYEFYYQHNPMNTHWMNMSWSHTRSRDLLHWERCETVMLPDPDGTIFSGYGIANTGGHFGLPEDALLFFYTRAGNNPYPWDTGKPFDQMLAYSLDGGKTLIRTDIVLIPDPHGKTKDPRDPSIRWYEEGGFWYIVMYDGNFVSTIYKSEDMEHWSVLQKLDLSAFKMRECPDMFSVIRQDGSKVWIFWTADGYYLMGTFDGTSFQHDGIRHEAYAGPLGYAAQCWRGLGDELVTVSWLQTFSEGQNYRSIYSIPRQITVSSQDGQNRLHFHIIPQFLEQRRLSGEITGSFAKWEAVADEVLNLETYAPEACDIIWEFPGIRLTYRQSEGRFIIDGQCKHIRRTYPCDLPPAVVETGAYEVAVPSGIKDFSLIYDRGILEIAADDETWICYVELPADHFGGDVSVTAEREIRADFYTIK